MEVVKLTMAKLSITYNHDKEKYIFNKYRDAFEEHEGKSPNLNQPADKKKANKIAQELRQAWEPKEKEFIKNLNWFYDCEFKIDGWTGYLIRSRICPYSPDEKFFAISLDKPLSDQLLTIGHELFHQPFHFHWEEKCLEIFQDEQVVHCLKESLTELLNTPKFNLTDEIDPGWGDPCEEFIRHLIKKYHRENGPFKFKAFLQWIK